MKAMSPHFLRMSIKSPVDIDEKLFEGFFRDEIFSSWASGNRSWQLHLFGGPGCGKTILSSLVANYLRDHNSSAVTIISIERQAAQGGKITTEAILQYIQDQTFVRERIASSSAPHSFVLLDGFDELPEQVQTILQDYLSKLSSSNRRVLLTRRVPEFVGSINGKCEVFSCDNPNCNAKDLRLFWESDFSATDADDRCVFMLCNPCYESGERCLHPLHSGAMVEPYTYRNIEVTLDRDSIQRFVQADLEREYGASNIPSKVVETIVDKAGNNISIAKLRLDHTRDLSSPLDTYNLSDRLPRSIIAFYDAEISRIDATNQTHRKQVLMALVAATENDEISSKQLENLLRNVNTNNQQNSGDSDLAVEGVVRMSRGLLWMRAGSEVRTYHLHLCNYVQEDYNEELMEAKRLLEAVRRPTADTAAIWRHENGSMVKRQLHFPPSRQISTDSGYFSAVPSPGEISRVNTPSDTRTLMSRAASLSLNLNEGRISEALRSTGDTRSICPFCEAAILHSRTLNGTYDRGEQDLKASSGCFICSSILEYATVKQEGFQNPLVKCERLKHHWSLRTTGPTGAEFTTTLTLQPATLLFGTSPRRYHFVSASDLDPIPDPAHLPPSTHLEHAGPQVASWLQACTTKHVYCVRPTPQSYIPKRLVCISASSSPSTIRITLTTNNLPVITPYATLSHCWGTSTFLTLTRENEAQLTCGIPLTSLTTNFQEAIQVARFIGMQYIWIDSLCIMQGEGGDFGTEGDLMHAVYRNSYCNIVAADSKDSTGGLFRPQRDKGSRTDCRRSDVLPSRYKSKAESVLGEGEWKILHEGMWSDELLGAPIYERGWVFQERMLSPRLLHFTRSQIFWDCSTLSACEAFPTGIPYHLDQHASVDRHWRARLQSTSLDSLTPSLSGGPNDDSPETFWRTAVQKYTACALTNQLDKTVAIWSVAKLVRDLLPSSETYGAGLWSTKLEEQLAWHVATCEPSKRLADLQTGWPSWSWASVCGEVIAGERLVHRRCYWVTRHDGVGDVGFEMEGKVESRDEETRVPAAGAIEMNGIVGNGVVVCDERSGEYGMTIGENCEAKSSSGMKEGEDVFSVYPDESLDVADLLPNECRFIILAASTHDPYAELQRDSLLDDSAPEDRYSGIGLVLLSLSEFAARKLGRYEMELKQLREERDHLRCEMEWLEQEQAENAGMVETKKWYGITAKRTQGLSNWIEGMKNKATQDCNEGGERFRRIGSLQFRDLSAKTWRRILEKRENIWLE
ncbi:heterokaryon incompatibility protein-domain-containing protein [Clohesyomyces aquaticus]|uniref:Heterokaryon incompatibility protein-domain-containing protein n=1 Tax=Clohesyomyces aquaticus TaxID=1231657 RepID=A0A1Y1Z6Y4_9PLEO|nr:heterokaryon incompatibility protein-domain-containing protein [Clohesyomyces aquaticus]